MKSGVELIAIERERQVSEENWSSEHDDLHKWGELASAGACYANPNPLIRQKDTFPVDWPWAVSWWKPTPDDRIRELVKAGALIAAEIDRLQRVKK